MNKFFLDTNFFLDIADASRKRHTQASLCLERLLLNDIEIYTSSDILTTVAYFIQKYSDLQGCITTIDKIIKEIMVLCATDDDFKTLNEKLSTISKQIDYEDALQYYLANKHECSYLVTSDESFCKGFDSGFDTSIVTIHECIAMLEEPSQ